MNMSQFPNRKSLIINLADQVSVLLTKGITASGQASIAVSGGSTPVALFKRLSGMDLSWQNVVITLVDERWVKPTKDDSNEHLVRSYLLKGKAAAATFVGMKNSAETATGGQEECERHLQKVPRPFDVLILGMGGDGHTASLFPGAAKLSLATDMDSTRTCMGIAPLTAPHERMTLTLPAMLNSRQIFLHITGEGKRKVLEKATAEGPLEEMPIRFILRQQSTPLRIYWAP